MQRAQRKPDVWLTVAGWLWVGYLALLAWSVWLAASLAR